MIEFYKKRGETPLQALDRLRSERPEFVEETLSYAGRLDPMAEGILPVLVGEENKRRHEYLNKDKWYHVQMLVGYSTDTGDILGLITKTNFKTIDTAVIHAAVESLTTIKKQTYPWYSSKTVDGIPLFQYAQEKNFSITRPTRDITVYHVDSIAVSELDSHSLIESYIQDIQTVRGDFRQEEICSLWRTVMHDIPPKVTVISFDIHVSSGTYIRGLCESISDILQAPVVLSRLVRTKVL